MTELNTVKPDESGKLTLSRLTVKKFGGVLLSCKALGTTNVCKTWAGLIH